VHIPFAQSLGKVLRLHLHTPAVPGNGEDPE
jgi:hypothetical protein